jgi:hypothetical protein
MMSDAVQQSLIFTLGIWGTRCQVRTERSKGLVPLLGLALAVVVCLPCASSFG